MGWPDHGDEERGCGIPGCGGVNMGAKITVNALLVAEGIVHLGLAGTKRTPRALVRRDSN